MLDWKQFFLAYLRSRSRLFIYLLSLAFLVLLFQFLFASLEFTSSTFSSCVAL